MEKLRDIKYLLKKVKGYDLSTTLKKNKKGFGIYATKKIKKNQVIAYYKVRVQYQPTTQEYIIYVFTKNGNISRTFIGDLYEDSFDYPKNNIPYWGYLSNEPSVKEEQNCFVDNNIKENYKKRNRLKENDIYIFKLKALRNIKIGEELVWCYGGDYIRNYKTSCED